MRLENSFDVPAPPDTAWALLNDVPRVVPCMPGAALDEVVDDNTFKVTMRVKFGPIALQFATDIVREAVDESAKKTVLNVKAREIKGRGGASATIESSLEPSGTGTQVTIVTELQLQGTVASTGRGVVGDVANQLTKKFADNLSAQLQESAPAAEAPDPGSTGNQAPEVRPVAPPPAASEVPSIGGGGLLLKALLRPILRLFGKKD